LTVDVLKTKDKSIKVIEELDVEQLIKDRRQVKPKTKTVNKE
jgi:hypothetical protein